MKKMFFLLAAICPLIADAQLNVGTGTNFKIYGSTTYVVLHDISINNNGNINQEEGTVKFSGMSDASVNSSSPIQFHSIQVSKSLAGATISLFQNISVTNELNFGAGLINLNDYNLHLGSTGLLLNEKENGRIYSNGTGEVIATATLNAPTANNPGNLGAIISSSQNLGVVTIQRGHLSQTNGSGQGNSILRYYDIIPANNTGLNATLRLHYFNAELNALDENTLMLWRSENTTTWINEGYTSRDASANYVERTGLPSMARFTISSPSNPLPVTGLLLTGRWINNRSELKWITETENNNSHFDIERKYINEASFADIARRYSLNQGGNSDQVTTYYYNDYAESGRGTIYYRLRQADLDGRTTFSNTIALSPGNSKLFISHILTGSLYGNTLFIQPGTMSVHQMEVAIYDASGKTYFKKQTGYMPQNIPLPAMSSGVYYVRITSGNNTFTSSFILK